eukprot:scaffold63700_cov27-Tisochrysis_lutea.AAC.2
MGARGCMRRTRAVAQAMHDAHFHSKLHFLGYATRWMNVCIGARMLWWEWHAFFRSRRRNT